MEKHVVLLIIGIIIVITSLIIILISKQKKTNHKIEYIEKYNNQIEQSLNIRNEILLKKIHDLENEVKKIKQNNLDLINKNKDNADFKPMLNYSLFKQKNKDIVDLYKRGNNKEEIAKTLNKSVREVEMILKLVK